MRILIGYDGSEYASTALADLTRAGLPADAEVIVVTVAEVWPQLPDSSFKPVEAGQLQRMSPITRRAHELAMAAMADAREASADGAKRVNALFARWKTFAEACPGSASTALMERAKQWGADLIAVGSQGKGALRRALIGSVSQSVVTHAGCSVRIMRPPRRAAADSARIVVGIDGSPNSAAALNAVSLRKWPPGSEVRVVIARDLRLATVLPALTPDLALPLPLDPQQQEWPPQAAEQAADELRRAGLAAAPVVRDGDPKRVLIEEAERWQADCIFIGARGVSRLEGFLLGSVATAVSTRAECSVEVVRFE